MQRIAFLLALVCVGLVIGLARPSHASAGWCWPSCSTYGVLTPWTTSNCWYYAAVCSGWWYWYVNGETKTCWPSCDPYGNTYGEILYGFENSERIRGRFTAWAGSRHIQPGDVGMGGYLRAQVTWWSGQSSQLNVAAVG